MGVEPWGLYPPEINAGRYETGVGAPTFVASALKWTMFAGVTAEAIAVFGSQVGALTGNWDGLAKQSYAAATAPFAAWLGEMEAMATHRAAAQWAVLEAYGTGMATMVPLPVIIANRIAARTAQIAGVLGFPNTEMVRLELEYAAFWAHNASVMTAYDIAVNTATAPTVAPAPPPLVINGAGAADSVVQSAVQNAASTMQRGVSALQSSSSQAASAVQRGIASSTQLAGPGAGDSGMWSSLLGGGAGSGSLGAFGGGGSSMGSGGAGMAGGSGVGMMPSQALASMSKPSAVAAAVPVGGFGGVANAPTTTRPSMPMMPPMTGAHGGQKKQASMPGNSGPIVAAEQEFPVAMPTRDEQTEIAAPKTAQTAV